MILPSEGSVVITGANGYMGSHLVQLFSSRNIPVFAIIREDSKIPEFYKSIKTIKWLRTDGSFRNLRAQLAKTAAHSVIHTAAFSCHEHKAEDAQAMIRANIEFGTNLVEAMSDANIRFLINIGTEWQSYEGNGYNPVCLYAATKQAYEDILTYYINVRGLLSTSLRFFDIYGPNDPRPKILPLMFHAIGTQTSIELSPGDQELDLLHVTDAVEAIQQALVQLHHSKKSSSYSISSFTTHTLKDVSQLVAKSLGKENTCIFGGRPYRKREIMKPRPSLTLLPSWRPRFGLGEGIRKVAEQWQAANLR
jgi:nucleoside-diphosphate-sugar epimerase